jgi:hypothetical protein
MGIPWSFSFMFWKNEKLNQSLKGILIILHAGVLMILISKHFVWKLKKNWNQGIDLLAQRMAILKSMDWIANVQWGEINLIDGFNDIKFHETLIQNYLKWYALLLMQVIKSYLF